MGHKRLKKCSKYKMVIILDEKRMFSFANFLHLFIQGPPLTLSALVTQLKSFPGRQKGKAWEEQFL